LLDAADAKKKCGVARKLKCAFSVLESAHAQVKIAKMVYRHNLLIDYQALKFNIILVGTGVKQRSQSRLDESESLSCQGDYHELRA
jgi:hypothetical protein